MNQRLFHSLQRRSASKNRMMGLYQSENKVWWYL